MWDQDHLGAEDEHRTLKIALRIAVISLVIAVATVLIAPSLIDWNRYKPELEARLEKATGRRVTINGDLDATILWTPALTAADVAIANVDGGETPDMLRLKRLDMRVDFFPLLAGKFKVSSLRLVEPVLVLERLKDGRSNWFHAKAAGAQEPIKFSELGLGWLRFGPDSVSIAQITVEGGSLVYRDLVAHWSEAATAVDATLSVPTLAGPYDLKGAFDWRKRRYALSGTEAAPQADGKRPLEVKLTQAETGLSLSLVGRVEESGAVSGAVTFRTAQPAVLVGAAPSPQSGPAPTPFAFESVLSADGAQARLGELVVQWGAFSATGSAVANFKAPWTILVALKGHQLNLDAVLPEPAKPAGKGPHTIWPLALLASSNDKDGQTTAAADNVFSAFRLQTDVVLDGISFREGLIERPHVKGNYAAGVFTLDDGTAALPGNVDMQLKGKITTTQAGLAFDGDAMLAGKSAREFGAWLGLGIEAVPAPRLSHFAYRGGLAFGPGRIAFRDFEAALDGGKAHGRLSIILGAKVGDKAKIDGDLAVTRLNIDPYAPLWRAADTQEAAPSGPDTAAMSLGPMLAAADKIDGTLKLQIDSFSWRQVEMTGVNADIAHEAETLTVRALTIANMDGARVTFTGGGHRLSQAASIHLLGRLDGNDIGPALVLMGILPDNSHAVLGPGGLDIKVNLDQGSGMITADGRLETANVSYTAELSGVERPLLGILGSGRIKSKLTLASDNAVAVARPFGFNASKPVPSAPLPGSVTITQERGADGFTLAFDARAGDAIASGQLARTNANGPAYDGRMTVIAPSLTRLLAGLGADIPSDLKSGEALSLSLAGKGAQAGLVLTPLSFTLGKDSLSGEGELDLSGAAPRLDLGLKGGTLDLDRVAKLWRAWNGRSALPGWSEAPLPVAALAKIDGTLNGQAEKIRVFGLDFDTPHFSAKLTDGNLSMSDGRATLFGGPMTANAALRGGGATPGFALSIKFIEVDGKAMSAALWGAPVLDGPLDGAMTLAATGVSERAMAGSLNGDLTFRAKHGKILGFDLAGFEAARGSLTGGEAPDRALAKLSSGESAFEALEIKASIEGGIARVSEAGLDFASGAAPLSGTVDGVNQAISVTLGLPLHDSAAKVPLVISGPLAAPKRSLDTKALRALLVKESAKRATKLPAQPTPQVDAAPLAPVSAPKAAAPTPVHKPAPKGKSTLIDAIGNLPANR